MAPELERIEGIILAVYSRDHLPPHLHALYGEDEALVKIRTGEILKGALPPKKLKIVQKWLAENRQRAETNFYELNPRLSQINYMKKKKTPVQNKRIKKRKNK